MSSVQLSDFDAAQALLDLSVRPIISGNNQGGEGHNEELSAKLFLSCLLVSNDNMTIQVATPPPPPPAVAAVAVSRIGTVNPSFAFPKTDASEPSKEPSASTSKETAKRKSPDHELPRDPRVSAYHEQQTSKRTKLFKGKPIRQFTVVSTPVTQTAKKNEQEQPLNEAGGSSKFVEKKTVIKAAEITKTQVKCKPVKAEQQASCSGLSKLKATRDVGTQTDDLPGLPEIETMDSTIRKICDKIKLLKAQIITNSQLVKTQQDDSDDDDDDDETFTPNTSNMTVSAVYETVTEGRTTRAKNKAGPSSSKVKSSRVLRETPLPSNSDNTANAVNAVNAVNGDDMVSIGYGNTLIPARIFRHINWNSYTTATRKLLTAVFSRKVLATHSLTGKQSPAFQRKPPKPQLDAKIVEDIVHTVIDKCRVPESVVRTSITTKCADESKMYRTRLENKNKRKPKVDRENILPDSESD